MCRTFGSREWGRRQPEPTACQSFTFSEGIRVLLETLAAKCGANVTNLLMLKNQCVKLDVEERGQLPLPSHFLPVADRVGYKGF